MRLGKTSRVTSFDLHSAGRDADVEGLRSLVEAQCGVITVRQASRYVSRGTIRHRLRSGRWQQPHPKLLVAGRAPLSEEQGRWVAALAVGAGRPALLAGLTALRAHGLRGVGSEQVFVLVPSRQRGGAPPPGVRVHRTGTLSPAYVSRSRRPPRTSPARSVVDAASWARSDREAALVIAATFQQRLVRLPDVLDALTRVPRSGRRRLITTVARDAAGGATALSELDFLAAVRRAGLPEPERQRVRHDASGRRRYLDFYFARWRLHVEVDGAHHVDPFVAWDDMARQNNVWVSGDRVLRFPAWLVRTDPARVIADVRAALLAAGWPG